MPFAKYLLAVLFAVGGPAAWAQAYNVYDDARLVQRDLGTVEMLGFGRGGSISLGADAASSSLAPEQPLIDGREIFFDTWNVQVGDVQPGEYAFDGWTIEAAGTLEFISVTFNSYDASVPSVRHSVLFNVSPDGKQAVGSGTFTVLAQCPVASCIYIDVVGSQLKGDLREGYGSNDLIASVVPEPAGWALLALGLAVVGGVARRARG